MSRALRSVLLVSALIGMPTFAAAQTPPPAPAGSTAPAPAGNAAPAGSAAPPAGYGTPPWPPQGYGPPPGPPATQAPQAPTGPQQPYPYAPPPGYVGQPYPGTPYQGQPYQPQPYGGQPYPPQPYQGQPYPPQPYGYGYGYPPAYQPGPPPGYHTHDGFFLRIAFGGAGAAASAKDADARVSGFAATFNLALGGAITKNLILFGEVAAGEISEPTIKYQGAKLDNSDITASFGGVGPGAAVYFTSVNAFVSASFLIGSFTLDTPDTGQGAGDIETRSGAGVHLMIGKEWWISDNWGLGLAAQMMALTARETDDKGISPGTRDRWTTSSFGLALTGTYN